MSKEAVFTMKLESDLRAEFVAEAQAAHRPASQIVRELMREFVDNQRKARAYDVFLEQKIEQARSSMRSNSGMSNEEVEASFAEKRTAAMRRL